MRIKFIFFLLAACLLFVGCVPVWVHDYYRPEAPTGILKKRDCGGATGPPSRIEFERDEVTIGVDASETENGVYISVLMQIPKGKKLLFRTSNIHVSALSSQQIYEAILSPITYSGATQWRMDQPIIGDTIKHDTIFGTRSYCKYYGMRAIVAMPKSDAIKLHLPVLYINGQSIELPEVIFKKDKSVEFLMPVNC